MEAANPSATPTEPENGAPIDDVGGPQEAGPGVVIESGSGGPLPVDVHLGDNAIRELISRETLDELKQADERLTHA